MSPDITVAMRVTVPGIGDLRKMSALRCSVLATDSDDARARGTGIVGAQRTARCGASSRST